MKDTTKIWKVTVTIVHCDIEGKSKTGEEQQTEYFDEFCKAEWFAKFGRLKSNDFWSKVINSEIFEYEIASVRQLELKKHDVVSEVKKTKWCWE